ncbi:MAG: radical SAM protein [Sphaerochaeta sp.]|jgi:cyclic pyranopterin phosphate synthase|nr:radical SAM protein [Sphaerochaeta sp.]MCH3921179.1 radical SAM protein [Sphaerochaeta sp.]MCI2045441.1 radical SAM protein [Sphaerochaeta sp.]MCI2097314.1 radical SAM protein [Sphaerochaeta sp.]
MADTLVDGRGRKIDYLRVSVTEACDFQCRYCGGGIAADLLPLPVLARLVRLFSEMDISHVRITGGEPLLREGVVPFVRSVRSMDGIRAVTMTTNGSHLASMARSLKENGLSSLNVSLDATDPALFRFLSGGGDGDVVIQGIDAALSEGLPVKLNCVPLAESWKEQASQVYQFAASRNIPVRFIELMPFGPASRLHGVSVTTVASYLEEICGPSSPLSPVGYGPAWYRNYQGVTVGFIGALSHQFCQDCNRVRLRGDGKLQLCLDQKPVMDCSALLDLPDDRVREMLRHQVEQKPECHHFGEGHGGRVPLGWIGG